MKLRLMIEHLILFNLAAKLIVPVVAQFFINIIIYGAYVFYVLALFGEWMGEPPLEE